MRYTLDDFMKNGDVRWEREEDMGHAVSSRESEKRQQEATNHQKNQMDYTT